MRKTKLVHKARLPDGVTLKAATDWCVKHISPPALEFRGVSDEMSPPPGGDWKLSKNRRCWWRGNDKMGKWTYNRYNRTVFDPTGKGFAKGELKIFGNQNVIDFWFEEEANITWFLMAMLEIKNKRQR